MSARWSNIGGDGRRCWPRRGWTSPRGGALPDRTGQLFRRRRADALWSVPGRGARQPVRFRPPGHALRRQLRTGLPPRHDPAAQGPQGVPFFFLRIDKAGNVTKRFNSTDFQLAEYGGACPRLDVHTSFRTPGRIVPQLVEMPDGSRFFVFSRTVDRPSLPATRRTCGWPSRWAARSNTRRHRLCRGAEPRARRAVTRDRDQLPRLPARQLRPARSPGAAARRPGGRTPARGHALRGIGPGVVRRPTGANGFAGISGGSAFDSPLASCPTTV
jgi:hypothetical protein